jgi:hypothetical protein
MTSDPFFHFMAGLAGGISLYHSILLIRQRMARRAEWPRRISGLNRDRI